MAGIDDIKTDEGIANILKKLKDAKVNAPSPQKEIDSVKADNSSTIKSFGIQAKDIPVNVVKKPVPKVVMDRKQDPQVNDSIEDHKFVEDSILPWFSKADKDLYLLHYITINDSGALEYCSVKTDSPAETVAALKIKPNYLCDIDYYKSRHYVLYVKQLESDYSYHRLYTPESKNIVVDDTQIVSDDVTTNESANTNLELTKIDSDDLTAAVSDSGKYNHYVVFTDLGVADFIARQDEVVCPCCSPDLSKWFEEVSNHIQLKRTNYLANPRTLSPEASDIRDFKYDIVTMHTPGVITLDSVDNQDPDYQVHIRLKDEFDFLPFNRVLGCLKFYSSSDKKSTDDFRRFINKYFDVIV